MNGTSAILRRVRFVLSEMVWERIGGGEDAPTRPTHIVSVSHDGRQVTTATGGIYDSLTGRCLNSENGEYRAIHSNRFHGYQAPKAS